MPDFTGTVRVLNSVSGEPTVELQGGADESGGVLFLGGGNEDGDLVLRDAQGRQRLFASGGQPFLRFEQPDGRITLLLDGSRGDIGCMDEAQRRVFQVETFTGTVRVGSGNRPGVLEVQDANGRAVLHMDAQSGRLTIGAAGNDGDVEVRDGNGTVRIRLIGGSGDIQLSGADCAEEFRLADTVDAEPGSVLVIDDDEALTLSTRAYDRRVAGVVSGGGTYRPGIVLDRNGSSVGRVAVAMVGKVFCKVDASSAPVAVGDLLTTSPTVGHAMKAVDRGRTAGAVLGKALRGLETGSGLLPVLVALQ